MESSDCAVALTCQTQLSAGPWLPKSWRSAPDKPGRLASPVKFQCSTSCLGFCSMFLPYQRYLDNVEHEHVATRPDLFQPVEGSNSSKIYVFFCALKLELDLWDSSNLWGKISTCCPWPPIWKDSAFSATTLYPPVSSLSILSNFSSSGSCMPSYNDRLNMNSWTSRIHECLRINILHCDALCIIFA